MTRQVSLSEDAYARLRQAKLPGESFSDAVVRLLGSQKKDPLGWASRMPKPDLPYDERLRRIEEDRNSSWIDT